MKTKLYELSKKWKMASKRNQCNVRNCLSSTSAKLTTLFGGKSYCYICSRLVSQPPSSAGCTTFNDRRVRVQLFNVFSSSRRFRQGLPQGSVLAPLLFLFYINDLANKLCKEPVVPMFTEVVFILTTAKNKVDAEHLA